MAVNQARYQRFQADLVALQKSLTRPSYFKALESKLLDYVARNQPTDDASLRIEITRLFDDEFNPFVRRVFQTYDDVLAAVNQHYAELAVDVARDVARIQAIERANAADLGQYRADTLARIQQATREALFSDEGAEALADRIGATSDRARDFARTLAQTQIMVVGRVAKTEKARLADVHYFEYVGIVRETTRPFCEDLAGTTHHLDAIHQMRNFNKEPVIDNCGGWNCVHEWEPDPFFDPNA